MYKIRENAMGDQVKKFNVRPDPDPRHLLCYDGRTSDSMLDLPDLGGTGRPFQVNQRHLVPFHQTQLEQYRGYSTEYQIQQRHLVPFHQTQLNNTEGTVLHIIWTLWGAGGGGIK